MISSTRVSQPIAFKLHFGAGYIVVLSFVIASSAHSKSSVSKPVVRQNSGYVRSLNLQFLCSAVHTTWGIWNCLLVIDVDSKVLKQFYVSYPNKARNASGPLFRTEQFYFQFLGIHSLRLCLGIRIRPNQAFQLHRFAVVRLTGRISPLSPTSPAMGCRAPPPHPCLLDRWR